MDGVTEKTITEIAAPDPIGPSLKVLYVLLFAVVGMGGSYCVAWYGIRVNTYANCRTAFASLRGEPWDVVNIPLRAGMSVGLFLISLELVMMVIILLFVPRQIVGFCFLGFAIGESLGASALRIAGGIFTKIADIGSDLMKIVFNVKEDDPRNPGVIADCTGDNAGDSVGPTADGFETYGVTGVALIAFITLAVPEHRHPGQADRLDLRDALPDGLHVRRVVLHQPGDLGEAVHGLTEFDFEQPLTRLIWIASILCITTSFVMSWLLIRGLTVPGVDPAMTAHLWWQLATIISCGTLAAVLIPEFTKVFTSSHSKHVHEIVTASREGGASLTILSGLVAGNFSAFWMGMLIAGLMAGAFFVSKLGLDDVMMVNSTDNLAQLVGVGSIFAFGLVAFGFLCMGPVNIAVDSYGPVTDNAQSVFELAQTEHIPGIKDEIQRDFGFDAGLRARQALPGGQRLGRQHLQGDRQARADRHRRRRRHDDDLLDHPAAGQGGHAPPEPDRRPGAARLHLRRRRGLLVLRRLDAGRDHRRLPGRRVHQEEHEPRPRRRPTSRTRRPSSASARSTPRAACGTSSSP